MSGQFFAYVKTKFVPSSICRMNSDVFSSVVGIGGSRTTLPSAEARNFLNPTYPPSLFFAFTSPHETPVLALVLKFLN